VPGDEESGTPGARVGASGVKGERKGGAIAAILVPAARAEAERYSRCFLLRDP